MRDETWVSAGLLKKLAKLTPKGETPRNGDICGVVADRGWLCATDQFAFVRVDVGMGREGRHIISRQDIGSMPSARMLTCDYAGWVDDEGTRHGRELPREWIDFDSLRRSMEGKDAGYRVNPRYIADIMAICRELGVYPTISRGAHGHLIEGVGSDGRVEALVMGVIA